MSSDIVFNKVTKNFSQIAALNEVSFECYSGSITALIGANGAGKTTCLKIASGLLNYEGSVEVVGKKVTTTDEKNPSNLYFVAEEKVFPIYIRMKTFLTDLKYIPEAQKNIDFKKLNQCLKRFRLMGKLNTKIRALSSGMKSALALSIALSFRSKTLILDEPLVGLDPLNRNTVIEMLKEETFNGRTALYSSHIIEEVEQAADRVIILNRGKVLYSGTIDEAKDRYYEVVVEKPQNLPELENTAGVLYVRRQPGDLVNLFIDGSVIKKEIPGKRYDLKLKEIFIYLIEREELSYTDSDENELFIC